MNYLTLAFSEASKGMQEKSGSRANYARMEKQQPGEGLTDGEMEFISQRDSFYMATVGENGFPYIQFRGGRKGFLKVLDENRLGFIDFRGNKQYISVGNLATNNKVALILLDYPSRTRLKIFAEAEVVELKDDPTLFENLKSPDDDGKPERLLVLTVKAFSLNCQQHITPRFTQEEIEEALAPQIEYIAALEQEVRELKQKLSSQQ